MMDNYRTYLPLRSDLWCLIRLSAPMIVGTKLNRVKSLVQRQDDRESERTVCMPEEIICKPRYDVLDMDEMVSSDVLIATSKDRRPE